MLDLVFRIPENATGGGGGGAPTFIAATSSCSGDGQNGLAFDMPLVYPAGWQAGDMILGVIVNQSPAISGEPTAPAGWTQERRDVDFHGGFFLTFSRVLASGDATTVTIPQASMPSVGSGKFYVGLMLLFRNPQTPVVNTSAFAYDTTYSNTSTYLNSSPALLPTRDGIDVRFWMLRTGLDSATPPAGHTLRALRSGSFEATSPTHAAIQLNQGGDDLGFTVAATTAAATNAVSTGVKTLTWYRPGFAESESRFGQSFVI